MLLLPVVRLCAGGHEMRHNVACHLVEVYCGRKCGRRLPCGAHTCQRTCHSGSCVRCVCMVFVCLPAGLFVCLLACLVTA
jgi:hypothetical protein